MRVTIKTSLNIENRNNNVSVKRDIMSKELNVNYAPMNIVKLVPRINAYLVIVIQEKNGITAYVLV